ncbi:hypothetical protein JB92DRAFT_2824439 [Gautieria morchelliformis]|nr:hypothetical protein JB92DRAFT_2824439 [Gautieria morchelliformis]
MQDMDNMKAKIQDAYKPKVSVHEGQDPGHGQCESENSMYVTAKIQDMDNVKAKVQDTYNTTDRDNVKAKIQVHEGQDPGHGQREGKGSGHIQAKDVKAKIQDRDNVKAKIQ